MLIPELIIRDMWSCSDCLGQSFESSYTYSTDILRIGVVFLKEIYKNTKRKIVGGKANSGNTAT